MSGLLRQIRKNVREHNGKSRKRPSLFCKHGILKSKCQKWTCARDRGYRHEILKQLYAARNERRAAEKERAANIAARIRSQREKPGLLRRVINKFTSLRGR